MAFTNHGMSVEGLVAPRECVKPGRVRAFGITWNKMHQNTILSFRIFRIAINRKALYVV